MRIGNISNLPASITQDRIDLEKTEYPANEPTGPMAFKPGPTLLIHVMLADK